METSLKNIETGNGLRAVLLNTQFTNHDSNFEFLTVF